MTSVTHRNALKPGFKFQWYVIERVLGQGGFGITYLALDTNLDQHVAIKEYLPSDLATRDEDSSVLPLSNEHDDRYHWGLDRFISEARTLARFKHPNIVRVYNVFDMNNTAYMTMEYEHGDSLQDIFTDRKTLPQDELMNILLPILDGLELVHQQGFIHRDIKPANIFIRKDHSPVLLDFGSARMALGKKTVTLTSIITPGYAPFEQYYSKSDRQGPWTDIYSLGATLYRGITGKAPMNAVDRSEAILKTSKDNFVYSSELDTKRYSPDFLRAVDHALKFNEKDRPQSINEWLQDFAPLLGKVKPDISSRPPPASEVPTLVRSRPAQERTRTTQFASKTKKSAARPVILFATMVLLILSSALLGYIYLASRLEPQITEAERPVPAAPEVVLQKQQPVSTKKTALLEQARQAYKQGNLVTPPDNNAYDYYLKVLKLDNSDITARNGIREVITALITNAETALSQNNLQVTETILGHLEVIAPNNPAISALQQQLLQKKEEAMLMARREEKISILLAQAEKNLKEMQLTEPENNNAYFHYQQALALDPQNQEARQGIKKITATLVLLARQAMNEGNLAQAGNYLDAANKISPDHSEVITAYSRLNTLQTEIASKQEETRKLEEMRKLEEARKLEEQKLEQARAELKKLEEEKRLAEEKKLRDSREAEQQQPARAADTDTPAVTKKPETASPVTELSPVQVAIKETPVISKPKALLVLSIHKPEYESLGLSVERLQSQITEKLNAAGWEVVSDHSADMQNVKQFNVKASFVFVSFGPSSYDLSLKVRNRLSPETGKEFTDKDMWADGNHGQFIPGSNQEIEQKILGLIDKFLAGNPT